MGKWIRIAVLLEFEAEATNEASDAESLLTREVVEKVDKGLDEEEEEEDIDVHFKQKHKSLLPVGFSEKIGGKEAFSTLSD